MNPEKEFKVLGRYIIMAKSVKLADIAGKLGVSAVTVSKALSGQKGVSEEMREKIVKLADELGYRQPSAARQPVRSKSYNIAVLVHGKHIAKYDSFYLHMYQQVAARATAKNCFTMLETISQQMEGQKIPPQLLQKEKVDGVLIIGRFNEEYLDFLTKYFAVPFVYLDFCDQKHHVDAVISDSYYGAYYLTNYLFEMGHRKIAYVGTLLETSSIMDRYMGYAKSMLEHGETLREDWRLDDRDLVKGTICEPEQLVLPEDMPTAFVCNCDLTAGVLIRRLEMDGYRVPEDISVVGYDNYIFPGLCDVEITTYEVDVREMVRRAVGKIGRAHV